jgi:hypothetical protein
MTTPSQPLMPALRRLLDQAEPMALIYDQQPDGAQRFLALIDQISRMAEECHANGLDINSEQVRVVALVGRAMREAERFAKANAGQAIPADSIHGQRLLALAAERRAYKRKRRITTTSIITFVIAVIIYVVVTAPPTPNTAGILDLAVSGQSGAAYALAQQEHRTFPDDPETMLWLSVLAEINGDSALAESLWQQVQAQVEDQQVLRYRRGNTRLLALDLDRAAEDAQLLQQNPQTYPEGTLLAAGIAEARGDVLTAIELFGEAAQVAEAAERQEMAVLARVRMGNLMQYGIDATITPIP